jgi:hypothetical protein
MYQGRLSAPAVTAIANSETLAVAMMSPFLVDTGPLTGIGDTVPCDAGRIIHPSTIPVSTKAVALSCNKRTASHGGSNIRLHEFNGDKTLSGFGDDFAAEIT